MKQKFYIGMDGGGTKTHAVIADEYGKIFAEHIGAASNFQYIGVEKAAAVIVDLILACCKSVKCSPKEVDAVALGLAGAGRVSDQKRMAAGLRKFAVKKNVSLKKIIVESDARVALEGAFKGNPGIILIAGTGSIAFAKDAKKKIHRVGGWGRILGDEGSGYFIGRLGLSAVTMHLDGRGERTSLAKVIAKKFGLKDQQSIITAVYKEAFEVASVAPLVLAEAEKGDFVCSEIVDFAVAELSEHIRVSEEKIHSVNKRKVKEKTPLAFIGGLIANDTVLFRRLKKFVIQQFPQVLLIEPQASPAYGAVILAMEKIGKD